MLFKSLCTAVSAYSIIPVPYYEWDKESSAYAICFLPVIGFVNAILFALWIFICRLTGLSAILFAAVASAVPVFVTGGIHMDGFMDTVDALASHQPKERKLEIMKDPNCGAFSVIYCVIYFMIMTGLFYELFKMPGEIVLYVCPAYVFSRILSAFCAINISHARKNGMLDAVTEHVKKVPCNIALMVLFIIVGTAVTVIDIPTGLAGIAAVIIWTIIYRRFAVKTFGGVTGDTAGFFLQMAEVIYIIAVLIGGKVF